ncbi:unnamed protein product [Didymodactylos carnosus]|uniref:Uncharacterized protein n=1 Tax=Didymodactylos carnosus TaxID=1234261 RepID=A0A8S2QIK5_9BILA|nr:unnamed protein product [Didymodactylos carnosus]CAF4107762.1 unnamed protein product [Didymodactylos carnosus]
MYHQNPSPEAIPAALLSSTAKKNRRWFSAVPLIALCGLGILGLLLVATIVLALIPVYLPKRGTVAVKTNHRFFFDGSKVDGFVSMVLTFTVLRP